MTKQEFDALVNTELKAVLELYQRQAELDMLEEELVIAEQKLIEATEYCKAVYERARKLNKTSVDVTLAGMRQATAQANVLLIQKTLRESKNEN